MAWSALRLTAQVWQQGAALLPAERAARDPVNPNESEVEGAACVASVLHLPDDVQSISVITPPRSPSVSWRAGDSPGHQARLDATRAESDKRCDCEAAGST